MIKKNVDIINIDRNDMLSILNGSYDDMSVLTGIWEDDIISIAELMDGDNIMIHVDESGNLSFFVDEEPMDTASYSDFFEYMEKMNIDAFSKYPMYDFYGKWTSSGFDLRNDENKYKLRLIDIWESANGKCLPQSFLKGFCSKYQFERSYEFYFGPFLGWDNVNKYLDISNQKGTSRGIIIKDQTVLSDGREFKLFKCLN